MKWQVEPERPSKERGLDSHPVLYTLLACFLTAIVVFLATFFALSEHYVDEMEDYRAHYVKRSDKYDNGLLDAALGLLDTNSLFDLPNRSELTEAMIEAAIAAMGDRYGTFFTDAEYAEYSADTITGNFVGIGVTVQPLGVEGARIVLVHDGSPAKESGLLAGDVIVSADGVRFADGYDAAFNAIAGEAGSVVTISFLRDGEEMTKEITRAQVVKQTVIPRIETYGGASVGCVYISGFDGHTYEQFRKAVSDLETAGVDALLFDLRGNPGGVLTEVAKVLAYLLPDGVIAYVDYASDSISDYAISSENGYVKYGSTDSERYQEGGHRITLPVAVLVNGSTASAAELFTAALRDYATPAFGSALDVTVVGTTTYGKGTVQTHSVLGGGNILKMTVARYNPPSNENYDGVGIEPGLRVELPPEEEAVSVYLRTQENDSQLRASLELLSQKVNP